MEIKEVNVEIEKLIITSMIISDKFLILISKIIDTKLLKIDYSRLIASWCIDYHRRYKKAPHADIQGLYKDWLLTRPEPEMENMVKLFLEHLSGNWEREKTFNEEYALDQAKKYLQQRKIKNLKKEIDELQSQGLDDEAEKLIIEYKKIQLPEQSCIDVFSDLKIIDEVLNWEEEDLFSFPGAMGKAIGSFTRGNLIAFAAPAKRGKTFLLIETALRAALQGLRVIFFSLEMSEKQMLNRIYQNILGEPKWGKKIIVPRFAKNDQTNKFEIYLDEIEKTGLTSKAVRNKIKNLKLMLKGAELKLFCYSPHSVSVSDISGISDNLVDNDNFVADVIVIDYGDILKSDNFKQEYRHKINNQWEEMRALALQKHAVVVTATHTNKKTLDHDMKQGDMSEDIRKINHVSKMIGKNQSAAEKKKGMARIVILANREDDFHVDDEVIILECPSIGKPLLDSRMKKEIDNKEFED